MKTDGSVAASNSRRWLRGGQAWRYRPAREAARVCFAPRPPIVSLSFASGDEQAACGGQLFTDGGKFNEMQRAAALARCKSSIFHQWGSHSALAGPRLEHQTSSIGEFGRSFGEARTIHGVRPNAGRGASTCEMSGPGEVDQPIRQGR